MLITPALAKTAIAAEGGYGRPAPLAVNIAGRFTPFTPLFNLTGQPAITVPAGVGAEACRWASSWSVGWAPRTCCTRSPARSRRRRRGRSAVRRCHDAPHPCAPSAARPSPSRLVRAGRRSARRPRRGRCGCASPASHRIRARRACRPRCTRRRCTSSRVTHPARGQEAGRRLLLRVPDGVRPEDDAGQPPRRSRGALDRALPGGSLLAVLPRVRADVPPGHGDRAGLGQHGVAAAAGDPAQRRPRRLRQLPAQGQPRPRRSC